ncbi:hypothetical protein D3C73_1188330 [compost metagenome]
MVAGLIEQQQVHAAFAIKHASQRCLEPLTAAEQTAGQLDACGIEAQLSEPYAQNAGWQRRVSLAQVCQNGLLPR